MCTSDLGTEELLLLVYGGVQFASRKGEQV